MNLLNIEHISKIYGEKIIFDDASFGVQEGDKIGIVGINGTGKTTLLRMIAGTEVPDDGQIIRQNGMKIAHLTQNPVFPEGATILSYVQSVAEDMEWRVQSNLNTLGITDHTMKIEHLSGGQKRRVAMAKVLAEDFDLLLLDEPTNHLDGEMISWLEGYLRAYRGTVIMVTHDRYFLDQVTKVLETYQIPKGKLALEVDDSALSNVYPELLVSWQEAVNRKDWDTAFALQKKVDLLMGIYDINPFFVGTLKKAMLLRGVRIKDCCKKPVLRATESETGRLKAIMEQVG